LLNKLVVENSKTNAAGFSKIRYISTRLHGVTFQETPTSLVPFIFLVSRKLKLQSYNGFKEHLPTVCTISLIRFGPS